MAFMVSPLPNGAELRCGSTTYTITRLIARGGTAFLYSAERQDAPGSFAIKEACPYMDSGLVRNGLVIEPAGGSDPEASLRLAQCRIAVLNETRAGQEISAFSSRAIPLWDVLSVDEVSTASLSAKREPGIEHGPGGSVFCVLQDISGHGSFLSQMIQDRRNSEALFPVREIARIAQHALKAIRTVHAAGYLHGDVSPANLLMEKPTNPDADPVGECFLIDFGCSQKIDPATGETPPLGAVFSSLRFAAPEIFQGPGTALTQKADIFSVGCLMLELLESLPKNQTADLFELVGEKDLMRHGASPEAARQAMVLLRGCLQDNVNDRFSLEAALDAANTLCDLTDPPKFKLPRNLTGSPNWVKGSRAQERKALHAALDNGQSPVYIWGLGGLGKTELAIKLAQEREARDHTPAYLITYKGSMAETIRSLDFEGYFPGGSKENQVVRDKLFLLRRYYAHALFVLDNYEPDAQIVDAGTDTKTQEQAAEENALFQQFLGSVGQVVITTRSRPAAGDFPELKELAEDELLKLFRSIARNEKAGDDQVLALIRSVDRHPLTVELLAATIDASWSPLSVSDLLEKGVFQDAAYPSVVSSKDRQAKKDRISGHLKALFRVANLSDVQKRVMCQAHLLPDGGMDAALFWSCETDEEQSALQSLESHSWLRRTDGILRIHPLVREVVRETLKPSIREYGQFMEELWGRHCDHSREPCSYHTTMKIAVVFLHALSENLDFFFYAHMVGLLGMDLGLYKSAAAIMEQFKEAAELALPPDDPYLAEYYNALSTACGEAGDYHKQLEYIRKSFKILKKILPPDDPDLAKAFINLGAAHGDLGNRQANLDCSLEAVEIYEKVLPPDHPKLAMAYNNLGVAWGRLGDFQKQLKYLQRAIEIYEKVLPPDHPDLASPYINLGAAWGDLGKYQEQLDYTLKATEIFEKVLSPIHPRLAFAYNNLGIAFGKLGNQQKRLVFHQKAVDIREKVLPPDHPDLELSYTDLGDAYGDLGNRHRQMAYYLKAIEIREKSLPSNHPALADIYQKIGKVFEDLGDHEKALACHQKADRILGNGS